MRKVLITGHTGMLGQSIVKRLSDLKDLELFGVSRTNQLASESVVEFQLDLSDEHEVNKLLKDVRPDLIVHTAAFTNLQYCEKNKRQAQQLHINLTRNLSSNPGPIVYISTDSVFDGTEGCYSEDSPTYPLNYYAQSKLQGEFAALCSNPKALVLRCNIYGFKTPGGNSLAEWALGSFQAGTTISGYTDVLFNPLYVGQLADIVTDCIDRQVRGVLHVGTSENISKFEFLRKLAEIFGYPESLVNESLAPPDAMIRRPKNTTLSIGQMIKALDVQPSLLQGLNMFKSDYQKFYEIN